MDYLKNVNKLYFVSFFHNLIPAYVIERLFWEQRGMTVLMVVLCEIIYAGSVIIFEIPTGVYADKLGRKNLLVIGAVLSIFEFIILLFACNFWTFALVVMLAGIAKACTSGALNALLYDSLLEANEEKSFEKIIGRINSLDFIASLLAALSGSILADTYGFEFNYILSAVSMFIAFFFTMILSEPPKKIDIDVSKEQKSQGFHVYLNNALGFYKANPKLILVIIHAMAIGACITYLDEFWQLYLDEINFSLLFFGLFSALISLARIPGNLLASRLRIYFSTDSIILAVLAITCFGFFMTAFFPGIIGLTMIILLFLASGVVDPVVAGYLHHQGISEIRATIESIQSLIERAITLSVGIGFGIISSKASVLVGFIFLGAVSCIFFLVFSKIIKNRYE